MTTIVTSTGQRATQAVERGTQEAAVQSMRTAGRQLLTTVGDQILKVAVDRAARKVEDVADRLDAVAASGGTELRSALSRKSKTASSSETKHQSERSVRVKMGAAFSLMLHHAVGILQLIQRLAQLMLSRLARLLHRGGEDAQGQDATAGQTDGVRDDESASRVKREENDDGPALAEDDRATRRMRQSQQPRPPQSERTGAQSAPRPPRRAGSRPTASGRGG